MKREERGKSKQNDRVTFQVVENASAAHGREAILGMDDVTGVGMNKKKNTSFLIIITQKILRTPHCKMRWQWEKVPTVPSKRSYVPRYSNS
jgi:hypothetical protein